MTTNGNEFFYSVSGLMIPKGDIDEKIVDYIELFVDQIPTLTGQIESYVKVGKTVALIASMKSITFVLSQIHANWLMTETERLIRNIEAGDLSKCETDIEILISELLSLSIELQIAQNDSGCVREQSKIESYTETLNNISAINALIEDKEYETATFMLQFIEELKGNSNSAKLEKCLESKDHKKAIEAGKVLKEEYTNRLKNLGVTLSDPKKKILAVDDRPDILITVRGMLKGHFNVYAAAGGKTALAIMEAHKPDLFLLDIEMPDVDGFELAKTIRATEEHARTPIIFLTSNATKEYVMKALKCGGNDFIVKPASYNALMVKISKLI